MDEAMRKVRRFDSAILIVLGAICTVLAILSHKDIWRTVLGPSIPGVPDHLRIGFGLLIAMIGPLSFAVGIAGWRTTKRRL